MGILDDAIREHLELKRQHGAEEKEIEGLEAEAFGPADRPEATEPETRILTPEEAGVEPEPSAPGAAPEPVAEAPAEEPEASAGAPAAAPADSSSEGPAAREQSGTEAAAEPGTADRPEPMPPAEPEGATVPDAVGEEPSRFDDPTDYGDEEGDAGDMLEAERQRLASHPTEHYDVDAAMAEEDELDILSESSLSDELDRALEGPVEGVSEEDAAEPESDFEPVTADPPADQAEEDLEDAEIEAIMEAAPEEEPADVHPDELAEESAEPEPGDPAAEPEATSEEGGEAEEGTEESDESSASFFDQEDPLEGTPDFLEETPDHDRLWFEQREPKDFDFGD